MCTYGLIKEGEINKGPKCPLTEGPALSPLIIGAARSFKEDFCSSARGAE